MRREVAELLNGLDHGLSDEQVLEELSALRKRILMKCVKAHRGSLGVRPQGGSRIWGGLTNRLIQLFGHAVGFVLRYRTLW